MTKPFPCCCSCNTCDIFAASTTPNWILRYCGGVALPPGSPWAFVTSYSGNKLFEDLVALGDVTYNVSTGSFWDITSTTISSVSARRYAIRFDLPFSSSDYWTYSNGGHTYKYTSLSMGVIIESLCTTGVRRVNVNTSAGQTTLTARVAVDGGSPGSATNIGGWQSTGAPDFESTKNCAAELPAPEAAGWSVEFLSALDMKTMWKPGSETLSCP